MEYIDNHLDDSNLTLRRIANQVVFRHEDYVGKAFYAYTGENFSTYLNRQRIERAKYLIQTMGDYKFYTIRISILAWATIPTTSANYLKSTQG